MPIDRPAMIDPVLRLAPDNFTHQLWGGDWIPRFKGLPTPFRPVGESWEFSARAEHPSRVRVAGTELKLPELLERFPREVLGDRLVARSGSNPALLVKFIDARDNLSLQVHPPDHAAPPNDSGKSEAWVILETGASAGDGEIFLGFDPAKAAGYAGREEFEAAFFDALNQANGQGPSDDPRVREKAERLVLPFLNRIRVKPGEVYELRPGTIHAIGRGVRLFEVQQASDVTYRVWDWNRPDADKLKNGRREFRPLHLKEARDVLDFRARTPEEFRLAPTSVPPAGAGFQHDVLIVEHEKKFTIERLRGAAGKTFPLKTNGRFAVLTVTQGSATIGVEKVAAGNSVLVPACAGTVAIRADQAPLEIFLSYIPI